MVRKSKFKYKSNMKYWTIYKTDLSHIAKKRILILLEHKVNIITLMGSEMGSDNEWISKIENDKQILQWYSGWDSMILQMKVNTFNLIYKICTKNVY